MEQSGKEKLLNHCQFPVHRVSLSPSSSGGKRHRIKAFLFFTKVRDRFWLSHECCFFILLFPQAHKSKVFLYCTVVLKCDICLQWRSLSIKNWHKFPGGWLLTLPFPWLYVPSELTWYITVLIQLRKEQLVYFWKYINSLMPLGGGFSQGTNFMWVLSQAIGRVWRNAHSL